MSPLLSAWQQRGAHDPIGDAIAEQLLSVFKHSIPKQQTIYPLVLHLSLRDVVQGEQLFLAFPC